MNRSIELHLCGFVLYFTASSGMASPPDAHRLECPPPSGRATSDNAPWPNGILPYEFDPGVSVALRNRILANMDLIESISDLEFHEGATGGVIPFTINETTGISTASYVGYNGSGGGSLNINPIADDFTIQHELGHILGLKHEQQRSDIEDYATLFPLHSERPSQWNVDGLSVGQTPPDFQSIMTYLPNSYTLHGRRCMRPHARYARHWLYRISPSETFTLADKWGIYRFYGNEYASTSYTPDSPAPFELSTPEYGALLTGASVTFTWEPSELVDDYLLEIAPTPEFTSVTHSATTTSTSETVTFSGSQTKALYWRVTARGPSNETSPTPLAHHVFYLNANPPSKLHVDSTASAGGDGRSWATAFSDIADALAIAECLEDKPGTLEIRVAQGVYSPKARPNAFALVDLFENTSLRGGYAGQQSQHPNSRDINAYETTLLASGLDSVVWAVDVDSTALIEGFTLAGDTTLDKTRAVTVDYASPVIRDCTIADLNSYSRALVQITDDSAPRIENLLVQGNTFDEMPPGLGVWNYTLLWVDLSDNSRFTGLRVQNNSWAIPSVDPALVRVRGSQNVLFDNLVATDQAMTSFNAIISAEDAQHTSSDVSSTVAIINSTIADIENTLSISDAISADSNSLITIENSVLWNMPPSLLGAGVSVEYSLADGLATGTGNIDPTGLAAADIFTNTTAGDYSPAPFGVLIDAGQNSIVPADVFDFDEDGNFSEPIPFDVFRNPRFRDDPWVSDTGAGTAPIVDIGAIERTERSRLPDLTDDGQLDSSDALTFNTAFAAQDPIADLAEPFGVFDFSDILLFSTAYGAGCP